MSYQVAKSNPLGSQCELTTEWDQSPLRDQGGIYIPRGNPSVQSQERVQMFSFYFLPSWRHVFREQGEDRGSMHSLAWKLQDVQIILFQKLFRQFQHNRSQQFLRLKSSRLLFKMGVTLKGLLIGKRQTDLCFAKIPQKFLTNRTAQQASVIYDEKTPCQPTNAVKFSSYLTKQKNFANLIHLRNQSLQNHQKLQKIHIIFASQKQ
eukprot:TRINITY_DN3563_c0_g2_i1.p1 TRINITY_DN3563_c0_g2~~TRINITY_DN3563_c0_g2_i1.p1  ORF type:complete len:206 (-),score=-7.43 TRINITY_DN3563_c0_g2_i1:109-726(-)